MLELTTTGLATGGEAVGRDAEGCTVFVAGALAHERVRVRITERKKRFARAELVEVLDASPERIEPRCPEVANGCGGCDLAHASLDGQRQAKARMIVDAATRIGRLAAVPPVRITPLAAEGFRTTLRAGVVDGRAGLRKRSSHDLVAVRRCGVAHPLVEELLVEGHFGDAGEVTIRVGARTGDRMVITDGDPDTVRVPGDVIVTSTDRARQADPPTIAEIVDGVRFSISPRSFFQTRPDGAEALIAAVRRGLERTDAAHPDRLVDLCAGVGLFSATIAARSVTAVESNASSVADARVNLAPLGDAATIVRSTFERWRPSPADVVIADPSRSGLGSAGVDKVLATGAPTVVLVSCDIASMGRDVGLFASHGYALESVELVDLFPDTAHAEVVSTLVAVGGAAGAST